MFREELSVLGLRLCPDQLDPVILRRVLHVEDVGNPLLIQVLLDRGSGMDAAVVPKET